MGDTKRICHTRSVIFETKYPFRRQRRNKEVVWWNIWDEEYCRWFSMYV